MDLTNSNVFFKFIFSEIRKSGIDISNLPIDHVGISVSSIDKYDKTKKELLGQGKFYGEHIVSGRRIGVFRLTIPLKYKNYKIDALEIIEPKEGENIKDKFEHIEFTINESFEKFADKYPNLTWDKSNINRPDFPRLKIVFDNGLEIKFNHTPILKS